MAPALLLALALLAADANAAGGSEKSPLQGGFVTPPSDDYSFVGWCYGAVAGYVDLYEATMPEVERIERAWPTPSTEENIKVVYPGQRANAREQLNQFRQAMTAAEKASVTPIQQKGAAAIAKGRAVWAGADSVTKAQLAQFWMSWTPPARCEETAKALEEKSSLLGQAIKYNVEPEAEAAPEAPAEVVADAPEIAPEDQPLAEVDPTQAEPQIIRASTAPEPAAAPAAIEPIPADEIEALLNAAEDNPPAPDVDVGP